MPKENNKKVIDKMLSGRLWLTIIAGVSFLAFTFTICQILYFKKNEMTPSDVSGMLNMILIIVSNIFTFYFTKHRSEQEKVQNEIEKLKPESEVK